MIELQERYLERPNTMDKNKKIGKIYQENIDTKLNYTENSLQKLKKLK